MVFGSQALEFLPAPNCDWYFAKISRNSIAFENESIFN